MATLPAVPTPGIVDDTPEDNYIRPPSQFPWQNLPTENIAPLKAPTTGIFFIPDFTTNDLNFDVRTFFTAFFIR